jgi:SOS-response transcriptional repressor LexA
MHEIQQKLVSLSADKDITSMKLAELARLVEVSSLQKVKHHREQVIKKGLVKVPANPKTITELRNYLANGMNIVSIPILGSANAGPAMIYADGEVTGYLKVSSSLLPTNYKSAELFALKVVGDSMNRSNIDGQSAENGDYVIADARQPFTPKTGDYIVSLIDGKANLKKFVNDTKNRQIGLMSESSGDFPPIIIGENDGTDYLAQAKILRVVKTPSFS